MSKTQQCLSPPKDNAEAYGDSATDLSRPISWQEALPAIGLLTLIVLVRLKLLCTPLPPYDFMIYWAAGRLFLTHANPYSATAVFAIERSIGWTYSEPMRVLYPPWLFPLVALPSLLPFPVAHYCWLAASLILEAVSSIALWRYFGGKREKQWITLVVLATFLPAGKAEHMGQLTPLILAGLVAVLYLLRHKRDFVAGLCLFTLGTKPHIMYLVIIAVLLWSFQNKRWGIPLGAALAIVTSTIAAIAIDPNVTMYFHSAFPAAMDISCGVGGVLRSIFGLQHVWLQFLPTAFGSAWFVSYWIRNRHRWTWEANLPPVLLASIATAPYFWADDFTMAIPAFIALAVVVSRTRTDWLIPSALYFLTQYAIGGIGMPSKAWMATASLLWLVLYQVGMHYYSARSLQPAPALTSP
jgi:hypothetical protein